MDSFLDSYFIVCMCLVHTCRDKNNLVWIIDQSSGHNCYSDEALVAKRMNVHLGGKQPRMHPGRLPNGAPPMMVDWQGVPKGLRQVLEDHSVDTKDMLKEQLVAKLGTFDDFKCELTAVATFLIKEKGHRCFYLPKVSS